MDYSNFIILLARQRSGTNALRTVLETHGEVFCLNEVFNLEDKDAADHLKRETNFFNFIRENFDGDVCEVFPDKHETIFLDFLEYLRCFSSKRYILIDVKYNTTHLLVKPFLPSMTSRFLFDLLIAHGLRVINLRRKHYLRYLLSVLKAWESHRYFVSPDDVTYSDRTMRLNIPYLLSELEKCFLDDQIVEKRFASYQKCHSFDYVDIFPTASGGVSDRFLQFFSSWLGIENSFRNEPQLKKQSYLRLSATLENFDEISRALKGTRFEYCLEDEVMYK